MDRPEPRPGVLSQMAAGLVLAVGLLMAGGTGFCSLSMLTSSSSDEQGWGVVGLFVVTLPAIAIGLLLVWFASWLAWRGSDLQQKVGLLVRRMLALEALGVAGVALFLSVSAVIARVGDPPSDWGGFALGMAFGLGVTVSFLVAARELWKKPRGPAQ